MAAVAGVTVRANTTRIVSIVESLVRNRMFILNTPCLDEGQSILAEKASIHLLNYTGGSLRWICFAEETLTSPSFKGQESQVGDCII